MKSTVSMKIAAAFLLVLATSAGLHAQTLDFDNATSTNLFEFTQAGTTMTTGAGTLSVTTGSSGGGATFVYDTTPDTTASNQFTTCTVSINFTLNGVGASASGASLGIFFGDAGSRGNSLLALFNILPTGTPDTLRIYNSNTNVANGTVTGSATVTSTANASQSYIAGVQYLATLTIAPASSGHVTVTYTISDPTHNLADFSVSETLPTVTGEIGFRTFNSAAGASTFTNAQISPVPEPSAVALWGLGLLGVMIWVRRRVVAV